MTKFEYREDSGYVERLAAQTMDAAKAEAEALLCDGDWEEPGIVSATVWSLDDDGYEIDSERVTSVIEPDEPKCTESDHDWQSPHSVVGGITENPGVWGNDGGVIIRQVCAHCGTYRVTDTWAQDPSTGEQGFVIVEYEDADERSLAWIESK